MATGTAIKAALKFFEKLSIEDLSSSFNSTELKRLRKLILQERKKPDSVVTGKDIGKIDKAIKDRPIFEKARGESVGSLEADSGDFTEVLRKAGPKIEPASTTTNVPVLKKPRRKTPVSPAKRKSSSEQTGRNVSNRAFDKAIQDGVLTTKTAGDYMYMGKNKEGRDLFKHVDTRKYITGKPLKPLNKGGMIKRPQMMHGGSHKGKKHAYAAGGSVKEISAFK